MFLKRVFPYVLTAVAVCTAFFLISCGSNERQKTVEIHKTAASPEVGVVDFPHAVHNKANVKCMDCHHKHDNAERDKICADCHVEQEGVKTMHSLCVDCHISAKKGPRQCDECHKPLKKG